MYFRSMQIIKYHAHCVVKYPVFLKVLYINLIDFRNILVLVSVQFVKVVSNSYRGNFIYSVVWMNALDRAKPNRSCIPIKVTGRRYHQVWMLAVSNECHSNKGGWWEGGHTHTPPPLVLMVIVIVSHSTHTGLQYIQVS